jgi:hypothetical protein
LTAKNLKAKQHFLKAGSAHELRFQKRPKQSSGQNVASLMGIYRPEAKASAGTNNIALGGRKKKLCFLFYNLACRYINEKKQKNNVKKTNFIGEIFWIFNHILRCAYVAFASIRSWQ